MARANVGGTLKRQVERGLQFPITTSRDNLKDAIRRGRLACVPLRAGAYIQKVQPYRRGKDFRTEPLWILQELSNLDKHRGIPLLVARIQRAHVIGGGGMEVFSGGPLEEKAILARCSPADADMEVDTDSIRLDVLFGEGTPTPGERVLPYIDKLLGWISEVIIRPLAEDALPNHADSLPR
jgi:hypothetical protein